MNINLTLMQHLHAILPLEIQSVFQAYMVSAKNIRNKTIFIITNIQSAYSFDKESKSFELKEKLHENQQNIIKIANIVINQLNESNLTKHNSKNLVLTESDRKEFKPMKLFTKVISKDTYYQTTHKTLIEYIIKYQEQNSLYKDYTIVNSILAQNTVHKVCDDFKHYSKALVAYYKNPSEFTGKPAKPSYKNDLCSFEVSALRFNNNGSILGINKNHKLYLDFKKDKLVSDKHSDFYNSFDLKSLLIKDLQKKPIFKKYTDISINSVRVIPCQARTANFKVEYTIGFTHTLNSHYPQVFDKIPDINKLKEKDKYKLAKQYFNNTINDNNLDNINHCNQSLPSVAGIDLGHVNVCSIYYFTGVDNIPNNQTDVISAKNFISRINKIDAKLDKLKTSYYDRSNKVNANSGLNIISILDKLETNKLIKEFNSKLEDKSLTNPLRKPSLEISLKEYKLLNEISKNIYKDKNYIRLNNAKNNISNDYIHKLSKTIVDNLVAKDIKLLIIGKNTGWKNSSNLGKSNNRRGLNLPHSKLVELLKYKCLLNNILLVEQEESYTSKRSFADNEELPVYSKKLKIETKEINKLEIDYKIKLDDLTKEVNMQELSTAVKTHVLPQGKNSPAIRVGQKLYKKAVNKVNKDKNKSSKKILLCHADVNGAMNIIRKFISNFNIINLKQALKENKLVNSLKKIYEYRIVKLLNYKINNQALLIIKNNSLNKSCYN